MRAKPPRVLVIFKKSALAQYEREVPAATLRAALRRKGDFGKRLRRAHRDHDDALQRTREVLRALGARARFRRRGGAHATEDVDLVLTLGGDGTVLRASQMVGPNTPLLAINTAPLDSVGYFCGATKDEVGDAVADALAGRLPVTKLTRMQVELDRRVLSRRVLNDALFCHVSPAATTRYEVSHHGRREEQKSSGVWVATAAGSTAAIHSAGGRIAPATSPRLQFVVREPYMMGPPTPTVLRGWVAAGDTFELTSRMRDGRLYLDGPHRVEKTEIQQRVRFSRSREPLSLLGFRGRPRS
jgi:NAD+ kinase